MAVGRNELCPCGSGKKYKKCCLDRHNGTSRSNESIPTAALRLKGIFEQYNLNDILCALFAIAAWLPNISSTVKIELLYKVALSINEDSFLGIQTMDTYSNFAEFFSKIKHEIPDFSMMEDFTPAADFGNIKFYHNDRIYKVLYGGAYENLYEDLYMFQILINPFDDKLIALLDRSPEREFQSLLEFQNKILSDIHNQCQSVDSNLPVGYFEAPSAQFWQEVKEFLSRFDYGNYDVGLLVNFSVRSGEANLLDLDEDEYESLLSIKKRALFVRTSKGYAPVFSRDAAAVLFSHWMSLLEKAQSRVEACGIEQQASIIGFLSRRFGQEIIPFVSPYNEADEPADIVYNCAFLSRNSLFFIYTLDCFTKDKVGAIKHLRTMFNQTCDMVNSGQFSLYCRANNTVSRLVNQPEAASELVPRIIVLIPPSDLEPVIFGLDDEMAGIEVVFLQDFLYIMDEIDRLIEIHDFFEYVNNYSMITPLSSFSDKFASFKQSSAVLVEGNFAPDFIALDSGWGMDYRYTSLSNFWEIYPAANYYGDPREWRLVTDSGYYTRMDSKAHDEVTYYIKIGETDLFIGSQLGTNYEVASLTYETIIDCIVYNLNKFRNGLEELDFFHSYKKIVVKVFPRSLVENDKRYDHVKHLIPSAGECYSIDFQYTAIGFYGMRMVFDETMIKEVFAAANDRSVENQLLLDFLSSITLVKLDEKFIDLTNDIKRTQADKMGFKIHEMQLRYLFGKLIKLFLPETKDFKLVRNTIANLAAENGIVPGKYHDALGLTILNTISEAIANKIEDTVKEYDFEQSMEFLINQLDMLIHENVTANLIVKKSIDYHVDYDRTESLAEEEKKFISNHKNIRYLIEVFTALHPVGNKKMNGADFRWLVAIIDWLFSIYFASDNFHYNLDLKGAVEVTDSYIVNTILEEQTSSRVERYIQYKCAGDLQTKSNFSYFEITNVDAYLERMDGLFRQEFAFGLKNMFIVMGILATWNLSNEDNDFSFCHVEEEETVLNKLNEDSGIAVDELHIIINFLTLDSGYIKTTMSDEENTRISHAAIPVWEYTKRDYRYSIRPLIRNGTKLLWGVCSLSKTSDIWMRSLAHYEMPYDIQSIEIQVLLDENLKKVQDYLVDVACDVTKKYMAKVLKEVELHKIDKSGGHPQSLGDYDVLTLDPISNIVLSIECKYFKKSFCMKDAKRDMEKIYFGKDRKGKSYISKVENRHEHLQSHIQRISERLGVKFSDIGKVRVVSIFLTIESTYWTLYPPIQTSVQFTDIDNLEGLIQKLIKL